MPRLPLPHSLQFWGILAESFELAADAAAKRVQLSLRPRALNRTPGAYRTRKPGFDTPLWNVCLALLKPELKAYGSKVRLARYLGIPRQRLQDYLNGRSRLPDAELALRILHWLAAKKSGRDLSI
jgi:plasmid maintenance system antidote protein VapI